MASPDKATRQVLDHIDRAEGALREFRNDGVSAEGVLTRPRFQAMSLHVAAVELHKAIAIIERTKDWAKGSG